MNTSQNKISLIPVKEQHLSKTDSINKVKKAIRDLIVPNKQIVIYYLDDSIDALAAVYLMREYVIRLNGIIPSVVPVKYGTYKVDELSGMDLLIYLNICPTLEDSVKFVNNNSAFLVIDHHKTAVDKLVKKINGETLNITKPALLVYSDDNSASGSHLTYLFTESEAHSDTVNAISRYARTDKRKSWHEAQALGTLIKTRIPTVASDKKIDVMGEFLNRLPSVIFAVAVKFFSHHLSVIVSVAANAFNNTNVIYDNDNRRKAILFTCDMTQFSDVAELILASDKNIQVVCGLYLNSNQFEIGFRTSEQTIGLKAIDYAESLGGGGNIHDARYICSIDKLSNAIKIVKEMI